MNEKYLNRYEVNQLPGIKKGHFFRKKCNEKTKKLFEIALASQKFAADNRKLLLVQSGYAMDLAVGFISRNHDDLDLIVLEKDFDFFKKHFSSNGYQIGCTEGHDPNYSFTFQKNDLHGDVDSIQINQDEVSDIEKVGEDRWVWPIKASELIWSRAINNLDIYFTSPFLVYHFKKLVRKRGVTREKETLDFQLLEKHFSFS